jgi:Na+/melibiose symporter-like transporter
MTKVADGRIDESALAPELRQYYGNRRLMWRNLFWLTILNGGWNIVFTVISPLMTLRMNSPQVGMGEGMIATIFSINGYAISFLVMYFSWKSDHTISRWGRRIPFLWISAPGIILSIIVFPFVINMWLLVGVMVVQMFFTDWKASTISLLAIDLVPRTMLARTGWIVGIVPGIICFFALRYGMKLADLNEKLPYLIGAGILVVTSLSAGMSIKEPPIQKPQTETFKPWSALKVGWHDRRIVVLMLALPMLLASNVMYNSWLWLFAKNVLHLTRTDMGAVLSWAGLIGMPLGFIYAWLIDRFSPYKLTAIYVLMQVVLCVALFRVHNATGLLVVSVIWILGVGFASAAGMILWRALPPTEVGSITSAAAFINNAFNATLMLLSGQLVERLGHNYHVAFILGMGFTACGFALLMVFRRMVRHSPITHRATAVKAPVAAHVN